MAAVACVSEKFMNILARGHECNVWLLIACASGKYDYLARGHECNVWLLIACVMFILARAHEFNWLLIACGSENFMIGFGQGPSRLSCLAVGWFGWAMFDSDLIMRDHVGPHVKPCVV